MGIPQVKDKPQEESRNSFSTGGDIFDSADGLDETRDSRSADTSWWPASTPNILLRWILYVTAFTVSAGALGAVTGGWIANQTALSVGYRGDATLPGALFGFAFAQAIIVPLATLPATTSVV